MPKRRNLHEGKSCGPCQRCGDMKCQYYAIQYIGNKSYNREVQGGDVDIKGTNGCGCKTNCGSGRCKCYKSGQHCGPGCMCLDLDTKCVNKHTNATTHDISDSDSCSGSDSTANYTQGFILFILNFLDT